MTVEQIVLGGLAIAVAYGLLKRLVDLPGHERTRKRRAWEEAARTLGLRMTARPGYDWGRLAGRIDDVRLEVAQAASTVRPEAPDVTRITARPEGRAAGRFSATHAEWHVGPSDDRVLTGDHRIDTCLVIRGEPAHVLATLGAAERDELLEVMDRLAPGGWSVHVPEGDLREVRVERAGRVEDAAELVAAVRGAVSIARLLVVEERSSARALVARMSDPSAAVRARVLDTLLDEIAVHSALVRDASTTALDDESALVRCIAARALIARRTGGNDRERAARTLEACVGDIALSDEQRVLAIEALASYEPRIAAEVVGTALRGPATRVRDAAVAAAGRLRLSHEVPQIAALIGDTAEAGRIVIARALRDINEPACEPPLLRLATMTADDVRIAAFQALRDIGERESLAGLLEIDATGDLSRAERAALRVAIESIRDRVGPVETGRVSLADGPGGEVSVARPRDGDVSIAGDAGDDRRP